MPDAKRKKPDEKPDKLEQRHGVTILHREGVDSYLTSKLCLALKEAAKGQGLRGTITVRLDGKACR
jgi:hypothetical protein